MLAEHFKSSSANYQELLTYLTVDGHEPASLPQILSNLSEAGEYLVLDSIELNLHQFDFSLQKNAEWSPARSM